MDVATLKGHIKLKTIPTFLIFTGDEWKVQEIYINQISKVLKKEIQRIDSITDIYSSLKNPSFIKKSYVYVVRDDKELMQTEKIQNQIDTGLLQDNILILLLTNVDKRTKFYKRYKNHSVDFERLSDTLLKKYIAKEIKLSERNIERLIDVCEHDYGRILLEIDKIKRYATTQFLFTEPHFDNSNYLENKVFEILLKDGTIYNPPYDAIFDLVDAILDRNVNKAFDLLQQSYEVGEATMVMLTVLFNNAKAVLQVQTCDESKNIGKSTGLSGWQIMNAKKHLNRYSESELIYIVHLVQKVEKGIKTGRMDDEFAMQYILTHIL